MNKIKKLFANGKIHLFAIAVFFLVSVVYCSPALKGFTLNQYDVLNWNAIAHQSIQYKELHGYYPLWSNSVFSGMPGYQIALESRHNITLAWLDKVFTLSLPSPAGLFFLACIGFYILCIALKVRPLVGILGSLAYSYASYSAVIVAVGHTTKFSSMGYMPAVLAGFILLCQGKYLWGFVVSLVFTTLLAFQGHLQIFYYTMLVLGMIAISYLVQAIKQKAWKSLLTTASLSVLALILTLCSYAVMLLPTHEYSKESMRGGRSELISENQDRTIAKNRGLQKDYAFIYSYGIIESFAFIVPRIYGGSDPSVIGNQYVSEIGHGSKTAKALTELTGMSEEQADSFAQSPQFSPYWGPQNGTSGVVYAGSIICFLFLLGIIIYRGPHLSWLIGATVLSMVLAWGDNFPAFNYFLFDHLPYYNKFRAPSMALTIAQLTIPTLAVLGLNSFYNAKLDGPELFKRFKTLLKVTGIVIVTIACMYLMFDYQGKRDSSIKENLSSGMLEQISAGKEPTISMQQQANTFATNIVNALRDDRKRLFGNDLLRSLTFIVIASLLLGLYVRKIFSQTNATILFCIVALFDLLGVDLRYLNYDRYQPVDDTTSPFAPSKADLQIQQDTGYFRVYNTTSGNLLTDAETSYFHNSIGGYHPARLALYEDIITHQLSKNNRSVINMLNCKYLITNNNQSREPTAVENPDALGPCWLVPNIKYVNNATEEMKALDTFNPKETAIIDNREKSKIAFLPEADSTATLKLVANYNDSISYNFTANKNQFAVLSEVYYPAGWKAYIDGKEVPIVRVNYVLRGVCIPQGKHLLQLQFLPHSYFLGDQISLVGGIVSIILVAGAIVLLVQRSRREPHVRIRKVSANSMG